MNKKSFLLRGRIFLLGCLVQAVTLVLGPQPSAIAQERTSDESKDLFLNTGEIAGLEYDVMEKPDGEQYIVWGAGSCGGSIFACQAVQGTCSSGCKTRLIPPDCYCESLGSIIVDVGIRTAITVSTGGVGGFLP